MDDAVTPPTPKNQTPDPSPRAASAAWVVYILKCADGSLYTGITNDIARRCRQHNAGTASRYTRSRLPVELVYQEPQPSRSLALKRELAIKALTRSQKLMLIQSLGSGTGTPAAGVAVAGEPRAASDAD